MGYCCWCGVHKILIYVVSGRAVMCQACIDGWVAERQGPAASRSPNPLIAAGPFSSPDGGGAVAPSITRLYQ